MSFPHPFSDLTSKIHTRFQTWPLVRNYVITGTPLQRRSISLAWRLDLEMRRQLILHETGITRQRFFTSYFIDVEYSLGYLLFICFWIDLLRVLSTTRTTCADARHSPSLPLCVINTKKKRLADYESQKKNANKKISSNAFRIRIFLFFSYSFGIEVTNTSIRPRSSLENDTLLQKWVKCIPVFRPKRPKNHTL